MDCTITGPYCRWKSDWTLILANLEGGITLGIVAGIEFDTFDYDPILQQNGTPSHFYIPV